MLLIVSLLAPLMTLIIGWRQRFTLLWFYAVAGFVCDNLAVLLKTAEINHRVPGNAFVLAQAFVISFYYRDKIFSDVRTFAGMTILLTAGFCIHTVYYSIFQMNFFGAGILCAIYIGYGIVGYLSMLRNPTVIYLNNSPFFWINTGFFLYAASNCLLFLFITYLKTEDLDLVMKVWGNFFTIINILHYILIGIGLYKTRKIGT